METYRFKNLAEEQKRRLLLPISGGISSLVLLQVLDAQLQKQMVNRNRKAYDLVLARVILPGEEGAIVSRSLEDLRCRFPQQVCLRPYTLGEVLSLDSTLRQALELLDFHPQNDEPNEVFIERVLSSSTSVTTRTDLQSILLRRLLVAIGKAQGCESIIWGHSDTQLAALTLAEVAKGRGGSVPSTIADSPSAHGVNFNYPLRDLFKTELQTYAQILPERLEAKEEDAQVQASIRNTSIDDLLSTYISSQGQKYPSIMANVVRTASKLDPRSRSEQSSICPLCVQPMPSNRATLIPDSPLCYGCQRMKQDIKPKDVTITFT
jgi:cytoplasmic tRNA 2-thiolation protein 2